MAAAANYAWVNRSSMTFLVRQAFAKQFNSQPDDLDMHVVYDVSHNIAKVEQHMVEGQIKTLLVHRKGSTRAFPPHHPLIPVDYQFIGTNYIGNHFQLFFYNFIGRSTCTDWWNNGNMFICIDGDTKRNGRDIWFHLSWGRTGAK